jgi:hypothetical protein
MVFNRAYLRKIEFILLYLYGFERTNDKNNKESNKKKNRKEIKNLTVLRCGEFNKIIKVGKRRDLNIIGSL